MAFLLEIHSILRWIILFIGIIAMAKFLVGWLRKSEFGKIDRGLSAAFSGLLDLQVTLGLVYFVVIGFGGAGFPLYNIEHTVIMLIAAFVAHAPAMLKKRPLDKFVVSLAAVILSLLLIYIGIARLPGGWSR